MINSQLPPGRELQPMTIAHGQKLFDQARRIGAEIETLKPLLTLLAAPQEPTDDDPINRLIALLEQISNVQLQHDESLFHLHQKLDQVLAALDISSPCDESGV